jgi:hypothetical protein
MEMINRCLEMTADKKVALEEFDRAKQRKEMIAMRGESRSPDFGNRKYRRRLAAQQRQLEKAAR